MWDGQHTSSIIPNHRHLSHLPARQRVPAQPRWDGSEWAAKSAGCWDAAGACSCPQPPTPAHSRGQERFSLQSPPQLVPASYNGPFEQGQLTARWQRGWKEKFAAGGKSKFISRSCRGNECQFPKQNCYFSARLTVAWELEGGQAAAFNFRYCGINTFLPVGSAGGDAHLVGSTLRRNGGATSCPSAAAFNSTDTDFVHPGTLLHGWGRG